MNADIIKEYLVSLGFSVNNSTYNQFNQTLQSAQKTAEAATTGMARSFVTASATMVAAIGTVTVATGSLLHNLAAADMGYQKLAMRMWLSKQSAKELKTTLDALGESLEDAAFIPELRGQFQSLLSQGRSMAVPGAEYAQQMKDIRSIGFEFKRLKLESSHAMEWVGFYLVKYLAEPLAKIKKWFADLNDQITKSMPVWTEKIARGLAMFMNAVMAFGRYLQFIRETINEIWDSFPKGIKIAVSALLAFGAILLSGPIGQFLAMMSMAMILVEDFYGYIDGRESSKTLAPMWKWLLEFFKEVKESPAIKRLKLSITELMTALQSLGIEIGKFLTPGEGSGDKMLTWAEKLAIFISDSVRGITFLIEAFTHLMRGDFMEWFSDEFRKKRDESRKQNPNGPDIWGKKYPLGPPITGPSPSPRDSYKSPYDDEDLGDGAGTGGHWQQLADRVSAKTGIPANLIYGQWAHESANFSSDLYRETHNAAGLTQIQPNGYPQPDGAYYYRTFGSDEEFADAYARYISHRDFSGIENSRTPEQFASYLKGGGYYTDNESRYAEGIRNGMGGYSGGSRTAAGGSDLSLGGFAPNVSYGGASATTVNYINVTPPPGGDANAYADAIVAKLENYQGRAQVRVIQQFRELQGVQA